VRVHDRGATLAREAERFDRAHDIATVRRAVEGDEDVTIRSSGFLAGDEHRTRGRAEYFLGDGAAHGIRERVTTVRAQDDESRHLAIGGIEDDAGRMAAVHRDLGLRHPAPRGRRHSRREPRIGAANPLLQRARPGGIRRNRMQHGQPRRERVGEIAGPIDGGVGLGQKVSGG
jgi:hypothetical protein